MVQQCSENQYRWVHFTVYMCVERLNSFGALQTVLCRILLKQSCWTLSNVRCLCVLYRVRVRRVIMTYCVLQVCGRDADQEQAEGIFRAGRQRDGEVGSPETVLRFPARGSRPAIGYPWALSRRCVWTSESRFLVASHYYSKLQWSVLCCSNVVSRS
jgi:hypothetical protein